MSQLVDDRPMSKKESDLTSANKDETTIFKHKLQNRINCKILQTLHAVFAGRDRLAPWFL